MFSVLASRDSICSLDNFRKLINPDWGIFKISSDANRTGMRGWDDFGGVVKLKNK